MRFLDVQNAPEDYGMARVLALVGGYKYCFTTPSHLDIKDIKNSPVSQKDA
jgi:hypothetical protein